MFLYFPKAVSGCRSTGGDGASGWGKGPGCTFGGKWMRWVGWSFILSNLPLLKCFYFSPNAEGISSSLPALAISPKGRQDSFISVTLGAAAA